MTTLPQTRLMMRSTFRLKRWPANWSTVVTPVNHRQEAEVTPRMNR